MAVDQSSEQPEGGCFFPLVEIINLISGQPPLTIMNPAHPGWILWQRALTVKSRGWTVRGVDVADGEKLLHVGDFLEWAITERFKIHSEKLISAVEEREIPLKGYQRELVLEPPRLIEEREELSSMLGRVSSLSERDEIQRRISDVEVSLRRYQDHGVSEKLDSTSLGAASDQSEEGTLLQPSSWDELVREVERWKAEVQGRKQQGTKMARPMMARALADLVFQAAKQVDPEFDQHTLQGTVSDLHALLLKLAPDYVPNSPETLRDNLKGRSHHVHSGSLCTFTQVVDDSPWPRVFPEAFEK